MDTQTAIDTLTVMLNTINSQITGYQVQAVAIQISISQLQGILVTTNTNLQTQLDAANVKISTQADTIASLQTQINADQQDIATLESQLPLPPTSEPPIDTQPQ